MWPVGVVVVDVVADESFDLTLVPDDGSGQPVGLLEEFSADGSNPSFGEAVRDGNPYWGLEDLEAFGSEDLIERFDELAAAVSHERPCIVETLAVSDEQVAGCLGGPCAGRVRSDASEAHLAGFDGDEEQDVVAAQECSVDGEEVTGDRSLGLEEFCPCDVGSVGGWVDAVVGEDLPDRGVCELVAESGEFALDTAMSPRSGSRLRVARSVGAARR